MTTTTTTTNLASDDQVAADELAELVILVRNFGARPCRWGLAVALGLEREPPGHAGRLDRRWPHQTPPPKP